MTSNTCSCSSSAEREKCLFGETLMLCCPRCGVCEVPVDSAGLARILSLGIIARSLQEGSDVQGISRVFQIPVGLVLLQLQPNQLEAMPKKKAMFLKKSIERLCQSLKVQIQQAIGSAKSEIGQRSEPCLGYSLIDEETSTLVVGLLLRAGDDPAPVLWKHTPHSLMEHGFTFDRLRVLIGEAEH